MDKNEFLSRLRKKLRRLPPEDARDAAEYYEEYLEDAGPENEAAAIASFGRPETVASQILADYAVKRMGKDPSAKKGLSTVWIVLLAVFASPIAIPVAAVIAILVLLAAALVLVAVACVYAAAIGAAALGTVTLLTGICLVFNSFQTAVFYIGAGIFTVGAGTALFVFSVWLGKKAIGLIAGMCGGLAHRFIKRSGQS